MSVEKPPMRFYLHVKFECIFYLVFGCNIQFNKVSNLFVALALSNWLDDDNKMKYKYMLLIMGWVIQREWNTPLNHTQQIYND